MFRKIIIATFVVTAAAATDVQDITGKAHQDGLMTKLSKHLDAASGNARRALLRGSASDLPDFCEMFQSHFGSDFAAVAGEVGVDVSCSCEGEITDSLKLMCEFGNVCEGPLCASIDVNATFTDFLDEDGNFGEDPKMAVHGCVDTHIDMLEVMCLGLDFQGPDFFLPHDCQFNYGDYECDCAMEDNVGEEGDVAGELGFHIPCYKFDCGDAAPDSVADFLASNTCKTVNLSEGGEGAAAMFLPALSGLPADEGEIKAPVDATTTTTTTTAMDEDFIAKAAAYDIKVKKFGN